MKFKVEFGNILETTIEADTQEEALRKSAKRLRWLPIPDDSEESEWKVSNPETQEVLWVIDDPEFAENFLEKHNILEGRYFCVEEQA